MYHESDPLHGSVVPGSLPNTRKAFKGYKPLSITQRQPQDDTMSTVALGSLLASSSMPASSSSSLSSSSSSSQSATSAQLKVLPSQSATSKLHVFELLNEDVKLPAMETLYWCKVFEFHESIQKQHLVKVSYFSTLFFFVSFSRYISHFVWDLAISVFYVHSVSQTKEPNKSYYIHSFVVISFVLHFLSFCRAFYMFWHYTRHNIPQLNVENVWFLNRFSILYFARNFIVRLYCVVCIYLCIILFKKIFE